MIDSDNNTQYVNPEMVYPKNPQNDGSREEELKK